MKLKKVKYSTINKRNSHNNFFPLKIRKTFFPQLSESYITPLDSKNNIMNVFQQLKKNTNKNRNDNYISNNLNNFLTKKLNQNRILFKIRNKNKNSEFLYQKLKDFSLTKRNYSSSTRNDNIKIESPQKNYESTNKNKLYQTTKNLKPLSVFSPYLLGYGVYSLRINLQNNKYNNYSIYYNDISSNSSYCSISNSKMKKSKSCKLIS